MTSNEEHPNKYLRLFWAIALGAVAAVLAATGSLQVVQTASIVTAFPMAFLLFAVIYGTFRGLKQHVLEFPEIPVVPGARLQEPVLEPAGVAAVVDE
jgi:choline-glycine betaine transporter